MPRKPGVRNRNYPGLSLKDALAVPTAIQNGASGRPVSKLALAKIMDLSPGNSDFRTMLLASRFYGLTNGGVNADQFELTSVGIEATSDDSTVRISALQKAVLNIEPFRLFLTTYNGKKVPQPAAFKEFLINSAGVPTEWADECIERVLEDARLAGFIDQQRTGEYVDLPRQDGSSPSGASAGSNGHVDEGRDDAFEEPLLSSTSVTEPDHESREILPATPSKPKNVFVAHGKDKRPVEEVKKILTKFGVPFKVAEDEAHGGRPISKKVRDLLRDECSSAILIFSADERFLREVPNGDPVEVWRPSENVVHELGAASFLYENRIVILKDKRVTFPSNYSDLGYITFEEGQIQDKALDLYLELKQLDIIEVTVKG